MPGLPAEGLETDLWGPQGNRHGGSQTLPILSSTWRCKRSLDDVCIQEIRKNSNHKISWSFKKESVYLYRRIGIILQTFPSKKLQRNASQGAGEWVLHSEILADLPAPKCKRGDKETPRDRPRYQTKWRSWERLLPGLDTSTLFIQTLIGMRLMRTG